MVAVQRSLFVGLLLLGVGVLHGQEVNARLSGTPFMRAWQAEDYDASPVNWNVVTHPNGLIYVANDEGVLEFDGARWRTLTMPHGGRSEALAIDAKQRVWSAGRDDIAVFEPDAHGELRARDLASYIPAQNRPTGTIVQLFAEGADVYLRCPNELVRYHDTGSSFTVDVWESKERVAGLFALDGSVYVTNGFQLKRVGAHGFEPVAAPLDPELGHSSYGELRPFTAKRLTDGSVLLLTSEGPLRWNGAGTPIRPLTSELNRTFQDESAGAAVFLADGRMAFAMTRTGILIVDADGRAQQRLDRQHGLPHNRIGALNIDAEGGLWVALHYGLVRVQLDSPFALHGVAQGVEEGSRDFAEQWGRLYVTNGEGISYRNAVDGRFSLVSGLRVGANQLLNWDDRLLASCGGVTEIDAENRGKALARGVFFGLTRSKADPNVLFAGSATGLAVFRRGPGGVPARPEVALHLLGVLKNLRIDVWNSLDTGDGFLWVVAPAGELWRVDFRKGIRLDAPAERFGPQRGVPLVKQSQLIRLTILGGKLCVSTASWMLRYERVTDRFVPETRFAGFGDQRGGAVIHTLEPVGRKFWIWPGDGLGEFSRVSREVDDGWVVETVPAAPLQHLVVNALFEETQRHTLWIAGQGALVSMDLDWKRQSALPPLVVAVRGVRTSAGELLFGGAIEPNEAHSENSLHRFTSVQNTLRFEFAAPEHNADFSGRSRTLYRTKLDGFDEDWTAWSPESVRDFTGLPFRNLEFHVEAKDMWGRVSPEDRYAFAIDPPAWLTQWALIGYCTLAVALLTVIIGLRTQSLRRHAAQLESVVAERTGELGARNHELGRLHRLELDEKTAARLAEEKTRLELLRYQLNPHFLYNALGSIRSLVHSRPDEADEMTTQLADFCRMTLTRNDDTGATLEDELKMIRSYLEMEKTRWRDRLQTKIEADPEVLGWKIPPFLLLPLVENAIKYGTRTSNEVVEVTVVARGGGEARSENSLHPLTIEVANTGTWVEAGRGNSPDSTGIGLDNLRQRLERYFPGAHGFQIGTNDGWVRVKLTIQSVAPFAPPAP